jgi:predicted CopG family antitoxin
VSKTIKLEDKVYEKLTLMMRPKETYSQVVERILLMFDKLGELRDVLEGLVAFKQGQLERLEKQAPPPEQ